MSKEIFFADDEHVRPLGRTLFIDNTRYLGWSCSGAELDFTGTELSAEIWTDWLPDEPWRANFQPYIGIFVDGEALPRRIAIEPVKNTYTVFKSDSVRTVRIKIVKLSENAFGKLGIAAFRGDGEACPTEPSPRKIEFIGDSITCGFGIEGRDGGEAFRTETENPCAAYAALTAERLGADFNLVSWSGIGVYSCSCEEGAERPKDDWLMPMIYGYTDMGTENALGITEHRPWDFGGFAPDIIVVNLGTNDYIFTKEIAERKAAFKAAYVKFLALIREKNPSVPILCTMGMMGRELCPEIEAAVGETGDGSIYAFPLAEQLPEDGIGSEQHPNTVTHKKAAETLAGKISEITGWR